MAPVQFGILGPVEVWLSGGLVVPSPKPRTLLAALLLGVNQVQRIDWLTEVLWGDRPPRTATEQIGVFAAQLRRIVGRRLVEANDGYLLDIDRAQLDLALFEEAVKRARVDLAARDYAAAAAGFRAALALWRGHALANVESQLLREVEAPRLEEQRLSAIEDRIEADLRLGQHAAVVSELRTLTVTHPLRERLWRHLIIALYRCRQRDAALEAYQRAEQAMKVFGVTPGPQLR